MHKKNLLSLALALAAAACELELQPSEEIQELAVDMDGEVQSEEMASDEDAALLACAGFNTDYQFPGLSFLWDGYPSRVSTELSVGGYVTVNPVIQGGQRDILVTRVGAGGALVWSNRYGFPDAEEVGLSIVESYDRMHMIIVGSTNEWGLVAKIQLNGAVVWARMVGSPLAGKLEKLNNVMPYSDVLGPDYIALGNEVEGGVSRLYAIRFRDFDGGQVWARRYLSPVPARDFSVGMQPDPQPGRVWFAPQHREAGFDSFSLMQVNPANGLNGPLHIFQPTVAPGRAVFGDFAVLPDGFIATYRRITSTSNTRIGVLRIGAGMVPIFEKTYREASDISSTGYAIFPVPGGFFDVSTAVTTPAGILAGYLRIDAAGTPVWHRTYQDFAPSGVSPMAQTTAGYLLRSMRGDTLQLTTATPAGTDCCERDLRLEEERHEVKHRESRYENETWGEALQINLPRTTEVPKIKSCS
jgi:hypothetical protein